jgi:hypothetical protein
VDPDSCALQIIMFTMTTSRSHQDYTVCQRHSLSHGVNGVGYYGDDELQIGEGEEKSRFVSREFIEFRQTSACGSVAYDHVLPCNEGRI